MAEKQQVRQLPAGSQTPYPPFVHQSGMMAPPQVKPKDEIDDMSEAMAKVAKLKMIKDVLNPQVVTQPVEKIDYSAFFKAMGDVNNGLAQQLTAMYQQNANNQNSPVLQAVQHQVEKLAEKLENAGKGSQQSDMDTFFNGMARMETMGGVLRKSLGIPDQVKTTAGDLPQLLGMEQLRIGDARAAREHDERMLMLKRQFELEDRRGNQTYQLEVLKFADERKRKENTGKMFEDLLGSVMESVDLSPDEKSMLGFGNRPPQAQPPAYQPAPDEGLQPRVSRFPCHVCQNMIDVPDPAPDQIECQGCHTVYGLSSGTAPPVAPPVAPILEVA